MNINNAILHVFDFVSCVNVFAQVPMDLGNKAAKRCFCRPVCHALRSIFCRFCKRRFLFGFALSHPPHRAKMLLS